MAMDQHELPIFRPKITGRGRVAIADDLFRRAVYRSQLSWVRRAGTSGRATRRMHIEVRPPHAFSRRVFIKVFIARTTPTSARAAARHLKYIQRDGVERDGSRGLLYGRSGPVMADVFGGPRPQERHQLRLTISPEDGRDLDLTVYVRRFMARVEKDLGQTLEWAGVNHHDTGHAHAHVVVRGVDRQGFEVRLDPEYRVRGIRWRAQEIATQELGPRLSLETERRSEVTQERYTGLDREITRRQRGHRIAPGAQPEPPAPPGIREGLLVARLAHLERYRLARRISATTWQLAPGWVETLHEISARSAIVRQMHEDLRGDPARYRIVFPGRRLEPVLADGGPRLNARVVRMGSLDERSGNRWVTLETPNGSGYYVSLDAGDASDLRPGDVVSFATRKEHAAVSTLAPGDKALSTLAPKYAIALRRHSRGLDEQVRHPGPVWLDTLDGAPLAYYGFGAEVRQALDRRNAELRRMGIDPADPDRIGRLRSLEQRTVHQRIALVAERRVDQNRQIQQLQP